MVISFFILVANYYTIAQHLNYLLQGRDLKKSTKKKTKLTEWIWVDTQHIYQQKPPVLPYADYTKPFIVHIDAITRGLGAVVYQDQDNKERVIAYASFGL